MAERASQGDEMMRDHYRHPRTLGEAFKGPDYADPIERPPRGYPRGWWACMAVMGAAALLLVWVTR